MTSTRCEFCGGSGRTPTDYAYSCCQFCGGRGWIVDPPIPTTNSTITTQETA